MREKTIYICMMNTLFSPWTAIAFPVTSGLTGYFEVPMFWIEHYLAGLINPLVLSLSGRYYTKNTISIKMHIFAHCLFCLWQRLVLYPLAQISQTNLNYTLCPSMIDPFEPTLGRWYLVVAELYVFVGGEIFHRFVKMIILILLSIKSLLFMEKNKSM
jgi:hypothetical protein